MSAVAREDPSYGEIIDLRILNLKSKFEDLAEAQQGEGGHVIDLLFWNPVCLLKKIRRKY